MRELAITLIPEITTGAEVRLVHSYINRRHYLFRLNNSFVSLNENGEVSSTYSDTERYRCEFRLEGGHLTLNLDLLYGYLQALNIFPLAYLLHEDRTDDTFEPSGSAPGTSVITPMMPVEILLTAHKRYYVRRELTKQVGLDFSYERNPFREATSGIIWYLQEIARYVDPFTGPGSPTRYSNIPTTHSLHIFGTNENPTYRRAERDTFARNIFTKLQEQATPYEPQIFEVIAGKFVPL